MAFGAVKGVLKNNSTNPGTGLASFGSVSLAVGDLIVVLYAIRASLSVTIADNLDNVYTELNAGTSSNGRAYTFYHRVTSAGTLTGVAGVHSNSTGDAAIIAVVFEGTFAASPLDINGTANTDNTSPFTCPETGSLAQADELVVGVRAMGNGATAGSWGANNSFAIVGDDSSGTGSNTCCGAMCALVVSSTSSVTPEFTNATATTGNNNTFSFKKGVANDSLTASNLVVSSPSLGTPSIGQGHVVSATALAVSALSLGSPPISQLHDLSPTGLAVGPPSIGSPAIAGIDELEAMGLSCGSPQLGIPDISYGMTFGQQSFGPAGFTTLHPGGGNTEAAFTFGQETFAQSSLLTLHPGGGTVSVNYALSATSLILSSPVLGAPALTQISVLLGNTLAVRSPSETAPAFEMVRYYTFDQGSFNAATFATALHPGGGGADEFRDALFTTGFAISGPQLGSPLIYQIQELPASGFASGMPSQTAPTFVVESITYDLTADGVTLGSPVIDTPALVQAHILASSSLAVSSIVIDAPTLGQEHALSASDLTTNGPAIDAPPLSGEGALSAENLITSSPEIGAPSIGQHHGLTASSLETASPVIDAPTLTAFVELSASELAVSSPVIDVPALSQQHQLAATSLAASEPVLGSPALGQDHALSASDLTVQGPSLGTPSIGQNAALSASALAAGSPVLGSPSISQVHALTAASLAVGSPEIDQPQLVGEGQIVALNFKTASPNIGAPALSQQHALTANGIAASSPSIAAPDITEHNQLSVDPFETSSPVIDAPAITEHVDLSASNLDTGSPALGTPSIGQDHHLTGGLTSSSPSLGTPALGQHHNLAEENLTTTGVVFGTIYFTWNGYDAPCSVDDITITSPSIGSPSLIDWRGVRYSEDLPLAGSGGEGDFGFILEDIGQ